MMSSVGLDAPPVRGLFFDAGSKVRFQPSGNKFTSMKHRSSLRISDQLPVFLVSPAAEYQSPLFTLARRLLFRPIQEAIWT